MLLEVVLSVMLGNSVCHRLGVLAGTHSAVCGLDTILEQIRLGRGTAVNSRFTRQRR